MSEQTDERELFRDEDLFYYRLRSLDPDGTHNVQGFLDGDEENKKQGETKKEDMGVLGIVNNHWFPRDQLPKLRLRKGSHRLELIMSVNVGNNDRPVGLFLQPEPDQDPRKDDPNMEAYRISGKLAGYKAVAKLHVLKWPFALMTPVRPMPIDGQAGCDRGSIVLNPEIYFEKGHKELSLIGDIHPDIGSLYTIKVNLRFGLDVYE